MIQAVVPTHATAPRAMTSWAENPFLSRLKPLVQEGLTFAASVADAEAYTRRLAHDHYENFSVISLLLPRSLRQDFCNVYAFCRIADDLGDELGSSDASLDHLARLRTATQALYKGSADTKLMVALGQTVRRHQIPVEPFLDLISAFEQDQTVTRYDTFEQLQDYCRRSANPVGRLVLLMCGYRDAERRRLSDLTCTGLQLVNFWQDIRRDLQERNRVYIPLSTLGDFGVSVSALREQVDANTCDERFKRLISFEVHRAEQMLVDGRALLPTLRRAVRGQVALFGAGGMAISRAIARQKFDTLSRRPSLSYWQKSRLVTIMFGAAMGTAIGDVTSACLRCVKSDTRAGRPEIALPTGGESE